MEISPNLRISESGITRYHSIVERVWHGRLFSEQLWEASKAFVRSEQAYRSAVLVPKLDWPPTIAEYYKTKESIHNDLGMAHLMAARDSLKEHIQTEDFLGLENLYVPEHKLQLEHVRSSFLERVVQIGMSPDEAKRVADQYGEKIWIAMKHGHNSLIAGVLRDIEVLMGYRQDDTRGRELGSPLPIWKILFLDVLFAATIAAIIVASKTGRHLPYSTLAGSASAWAAVLVMLGC